jgi:hypothetical protein
MYGDANKFFLSIVSPGRENHACWGKNVSLNFLGNNFASCEANFPHFLGGKFSSATCLNGGQKYDISRRNIKSWKYFCTNIPYPANNAYDLKYIHLLYYPFQNPTTLNMLKSESFAK